MRNKARISRQKSSRAGKPHTTAKNDIKSIIKSTLGISLIELLVVVSLVAVLFFIWFLISQTQIGRSRDARRKADLDRIQTSFEEYFNDTGCYPDVDVLSDCRGESFQPYLSSVPCDPISDSPYLYVPLYGDQCAGYRIYTSLEDESDPAIAAAGCLDSPGCGVGGSYNYGVSVGVPVVIEDYVPESTPTPTPAPTAVPTPTPAPSSPVIIYVYACDSAGTCNQYEESHPFLINCPVTFPQSNCNNQCASIANHCSG